MAHRDISDAESINGDEFQNHHAGNSPSDPTSTEIEDHVLTGHASFPVRGVQLVSKGKVEPRDTVEKATRNLKMARRIPRRGITVSFRPRIEPMRFRGRTTWRQSDSRDARCSDQVNCGYIDSRERS